MAQGEWQSSVDRVVLYRNGALVTRVGALPAGTPHAPSQTCLGILPASVEVDSLRARVRGGSGARAIRLGCESRKGQLHAHVDLERSSSDMAAVLELDYFVRATRWAPGYSMRLPSHGDHAELEWHVVVAQETGEDWRDVEVALTTASFVVDGKPTVRAKSEAWRPHSAPDPTLFNDYDRHGSVRSERSGTPPVRHSHAANGYNDSGTIAPEFPAREWLHYDGLRLAGPSNADRGALRLLRSEPGEQPIAAKNKTPREPLPQGYRQHNGLSGFDYLYRARQRGTFLGDGKFRVCPGAATEVGVRTTYVSVPSETSQVFRRLELINRGADALMEGPVDVYIDGVYAMSDQIELVPPQQSTTMDLGAEPGIEVHREAACQSHSSPGLLRGGRGVKHVVQVSVRSRLEKRAIVEVRESIPVPPRSATATKVTIDSVEPPWGRYEPNRPELPGRYRWREKIEPHGEIALRVEYTVRTPARQTATRETS